METRSNPTRAAAWLAAARLLYDKGDRLYNLIVEIQRPDLAILSRGPLRRAWIIF